MKRFSIILLTILLVMTMFVSCSVEVNEPETNLMSLRFRTDDDASKALTASRDSFKPENYYWFYTANKTDSTPATGTKTSETPVTKDSDGNHIQGLSGLVGPFSLGKWNFVLKAYTTSDSTTGVLVYSGTVTDYTLTATTETIEVTVEPQKTTSGTGTLKVEEGIKFTSNSRDYKATTVTISDVDGSNTQDTPTASEGYYTYSLNVGSYKVTVAYIDSSTNITHATNTIYVNVWNGLTTTISGTLDEITIKATFSATENTSDGSISQTTNITDNTETTYEFDYSPASYEYSGSSNTLGTTVKGTFAKTSSAADGSTQTLTVVTYPITKACDNTGFTVSDSSKETPVAGIDVTLSTDAEIVSDTVVKITTYIAKELTEPSFYHKNEKQTSRVTTSEDDVDTNGEWWYDVTTGKLVFATSSFSSFFVSSEDEAVNTTTNTAYATLQEAIDATALGDTIALIKDIDLGSNRIYIGSAFNPNFDTAVYSDNKIYSSSKKELTIDMNGKAIKGCTRDTTTGTKVNRIPLITIANAKVTFDGSGVLGGVIDETETYDDPDYNYLHSNAGILWVQGSTTDTNGADYTVLTVNEGITLKNTTGVKVGYSAGNKYINYGVKIDFYGKIELGENGYYGFFIHGSNTVTGDNAPIINITDATITTENEGHLGIYAAGYGKWTISGNTKITGYESAIEIRKGELTIEDGTFEGTATKYESKSSSSGNTTYGAAIVVSPHTGTDGNGGELQPKVTINGGTYKGLFAFAVVNPESVNSSSKQLTDCSGVSLTFNSSGTIIKEASGTAESLLEPA